MVGVEIKVRWRVVVDVALEHAWECDILWEKEQQVRIQQPATGAAWQNTTVVQVHNAMYVHPGH